MFIRAQYDTVGRRSVGLTKTARIFSRRCRPLNAGYLATQVPIARRRESAGFWGFGFCGEGWTVLFAHLPVFSRNTAVRPARAVAAESGATPPTKRAPRLGAPAPRRAPPP